MKMAKSKKFEFPEVVYVTEANGQDYYISDDPKYVGEDGEKVAIYQLVRVATKKVTHELN